MGNLFKKPSEAWNIVKKILYFTPNFAIWDFVKIDLYVIKALQKEGFEIDFLGCGGYLKNMCPSMSAHGLVESSSDQEKLQVCHKCHQQREIFETYFAKVNLLDQYLQGGDQRQIEQIVEALTDKELVGFEWKGQLLGRLCLYEILIHRKKKELIFSENDYKDIRIHLKNVLMTYTAFERFLEGRDYHAVLMYNTQYSNNATVSYLSEENGIKVYFTHNGLSLADRNETLIIGERSPGDFLKKSCSKWKQVPMAAASAMDYSYVTDHLMTLMQGKSIFGYSAGANAKKSITQQLKIPKDKKVIVVAMSSGDERMAAEATGWIPAYTRLFATQVEWVKFLLNWIRSRPDIHLIFRVHPREFPNKREQVLSEQAQILKRVFAEIPDNAVVNWPEDEISLYDLAEHADVFLNAWSSVGKEMSLLGFPVVIFSKDLIWYPEDLNFLGDSEISYLAAIDEALGQGWNPQRAVKAYRWMNYEINLSNLRVSTWSRRYLGTTEIFRKLVRRFGTKSLFHFDILNVRSDDTSRIIAELVSQKKAVPFDLVSLQSSPVNEKDRQSLKTEFQRILRELYPPDKERRKDGLFERMTRFINDESSWPLKASEQ